MSWAEVIQAIIEVNGGQATLPVLYQQAGQYRTLPAGDWQKTLRGVLYREVRKGRYLRIGLGVFALPKQVQGQPHNAYEEAAQGQSYHAYLERQNDLHGTIQGMLLEIGNYLGYLTYTGDKNRMFDAKPLSSLCGLQQIPKFTYDEIVKITRSRDVVWFSNTRHPFPKYVYDVETPLTLSVQCNRCTGSERRTHTLYWLQMRRNAPNSNNGYKANLLHRLPRATPSARTSRWCASTLVVWNITKCV